MIVVFDAGKRARAISDDTISIDSNGLPVRLVLSEEEPDRQDCATDDPSGQIRIEVQLVSGSGEIPAAVLTTSGSFRLGVCGAGSGDTAPFTMAEFIVIEGAANEESVSPEDSSMTETN